MATKKTASKTAETRAVLVYPKDTLIKAKAFTGRADILGAVVKDEECLTVEEAQARIDKFMKGTVK